MSVKSIVTSALVTIAVSLTSPIGTAYAKNGSRGSGESHESSGANHRGDSTGRDRSNARHSKSMAKGGDEFRNGKSKGRDTRKTGKAPSTKAAERAALNSLKRNHHAYLNSSDPRFADVFSYARHYAEYELRNGVDTVPSGTALSDEALREALATAAGTSTVSDASLVWAKHVLGVGDDIGKIDQIREALVNSAHDD
jgi:hypothetical protein